MFSLKFLKSTWFWALIVTVISSGIIIFKIQTNKTDNAVIISTIRPVTLCLESLINDVSGVEIREISNKHMNDHVCFHGFSLTTQQTSDIESSKAVVINGASLEPFINNLVKEKQSVKLFDSSKNIDTISNNNQTNPYIWLSFTNYIKQVENITGFLIGIFSDKKNIINKNSRNYIKKIQEKSDYYKNIFKKFNGKKVATFYNEFDYMLSEIGLEPIHLVEHHVHENTLSAKDISFAIEKIKKNELDFYLVSNQSLNYINIINKSSGIRHLKLSLLTDSENGYIDGISQNMNKLYEAFINAK